MQYYYRIKHNETGQIYIGCRYSKHADPSLFFIKYFTSSAPVKQIIMESGKESFTVQKVVVVKDARKFEERVLRYWYKKLGRQRFKEVFINQCVTTGVQIAPDEQAAIASGNANVRGKSWWNNGVSMKRCAECPGDGWAKGALKHSEETKRKRSESNKGKTRTPEQRARYSESRTKPGHNGSHKGTVWVVDEYGNKKRIVKEK